MVAPVLRGRVRLGAKRPGGGGSLPSCRIELGIFQTMVDGVEETVAYDTLYGADPHGFADLGNNQIVVPAGMGGRYLASCLLVYIASGPTADPVGVGFLYSLLINDEPEVGVEGAQYASDTLGILGNFTAQVGGLMVDLEEGDTVKNSLVVFHSDGFIKENQGRSSCYLSIVRIADVPPPEES